ncbi:hypothetical protein LPJ64_004792 [Coemansia asiatica]|uniref:Rab3 GTPase-activating protein catalytic subunit n=1 Tax=Coemansia asiatica TaxID=1052880 RepID=A0A9W7XIF9_9FUNG|nr:hypothetical protein LPJ64_004792 [Coemansia asiatica]
MDSIKISNSNNEYEDDDENFELVDYTAASSWEKFVASIETRLCQWRVNDGRKGLLDIPELAAECTGLFVKHKQYKSAVLDQITQLCTRSARLSYRGTSYALVLSVNPLMALDENTAVPDAKSPGLWLFDSQFPPVHVPELEIDNSQAEPGMAWHPLHRWTGNNTIIYMRYLGDSSDWDDDSFEGTSDNYTVSLETAKLLISSLNIAAQNVRCQLPMFVPVGDAWRSLFTGRLFGTTKIQGQSSQPETLSFVQKYESVSLPQSPNAYLQLSGLLELFVTSFRLLSRVPSKQLQSSDKDQDNDNDKDADDSHASMTVAEKNWAFISNAVDLAALHEYRIKNTYSRDWNTRLPIFRYSSGDLNVGPANDPLRILTLKALFQRAPCSTYVDPQPTGRDRLYLKTATSWLLSVQMFPADRERTMLTEALEDAFAAWAQSSSEANRHRHLSLSEQIEAHEEITSDVLIDLFGSSSASRIAPPGLDTNKQESERSARDLALQLEQTFADVYNSAAEAHMHRPLGVSQLIARMPHGVAVPFNSLLWRLSEIILVATAKQSINFWQAPSIMAFLRLLWSMALKEIRWRWENNALLPRIPSATDYVATRDGISSGTDMPFAQPAPISHQTADDCQAATNLPKFDVHLNYSLVYQKLEMLNCCLERKLIKLQSLGQLADSLSQAALAGETSLPRSDHGHEPLDQAIKASLSADGDSESLAQRIRTRVKDQIRKRIGESGVEIGQRAWAQSSRIRQPIGRLLSTMRPLQHSSISSIDSSSGQDSKWPGLPDKEIEDFEEIKNDPYASDSEGFVSAEDIDYDDEDDDEDDEDGGAIASDGVIANDLSAKPSSVSARLPPNAVRNDSDSSKQPTARLAIMPESSPKETNYVDVAISSSVDSTSGFHHVSDIYESEKKVAIGSSAEPVREEKNCSKESSLSAGSSDNSDPRDAGQQLDDPSRPAGGLCKSESLRLLMTDEPMWIPRTQMPPVLTEDMLREREAILMSFGTSANGSKQRARLQCEELISDMESFKAANPHCTLADFIRWHSPRDWIVPEGSKSDKDGCLSVRMSSNSNSDNLWQQLWSEAKAIPADKQKPLFDHEMEAEKALHFLEGMPVYSVFSSLLPIIFLITYERLYKQPVVHRLGFLRERLLHLGKKIALQVNWLSVDPESPVFSSIMDDIEDLEVKTGRCVSLLHKFPEQYLLVEALVEHGQAVVDDRRIQKVVLKSLSKYNILTAVPARREYVFTSSLLGPGAGKSEAASSPLVQRMYVAADDDKSIRVNYTTATIQDTHGLTTS